VLIEEINTTPIMYGYKIGNRKNKSVYMCAKTAKDKMNCEFMDQGNKQVCLRCCCRTMSLTTSWSAMAETYMTDTHDRIE